MRRALPFLALFALLLGTGCQQLFTTSLASSLAREPVAPTSLNATQAAVYAEQLANDPDPVIAQSAMPALADLVAASPTPAVVSDAAAVAAIATGLDVLISETFLNPDNTILDTVLAGNDLSAAEAQELAASLAAINVTADTSAVFSALISADVSALNNEGATSSTYVIAAAALVLDQLTETEIMDLLDPAAPDPVVDTTDAQQLIDNAVAEWPEDVFLTTLAALLGLTVP